MPHRFDLLLGDLQPLLRPGQGLLLVDAGRIVVADAAGRHRLLELHAGLGDAFPAAADLVVPVLAAVVMDPLQGAADVHVEALQGRDRLGAEGVDRGGHLLARHRFW